MPAVVSPVGPVILLTPAAASPRRPVFYRPGHGGSLHREEGTLEFLHRWGQLVGGLCRAGFVIEDLTEPVHADSTAALGSFGHRSCYVPPYVRMKARRVGELTDESSETSERLWTP